MYTHAHGFEAPFEHPTLEELATHGGAEAYTHELSGLPNRRALEETLDAAVITPELIGNFGIMFIDLDGLKDINDSEGHSGGDAYIVNAANVLRGIRFDQTAGILATHLSGDEFVLVVLGVSEQQDLDEMKSHVQITLDDIGIPSSIGAKLHEEEDTRTALLHAADVLMYEDKIERKLAALSQEQREAYLELVHIAAAHNISLRDAPALGAALVTRALNG
jgi:diguanylate cyclase (GGDEF)-like protein